MEGRRRRMKRFEKVLMGKKKTLQRIELEF